MPATLIIRDEVTGRPADRSPPITLEFPTDSITVRELIRERVYQEVNDYNRRDDGVFTGLVQPTDAETSLNGFKLPKGRTIDWKAQFALACGAFESRRVLVLVDDHQADSLEETITIRRGTEVTFLRLVALVGG